MKFYLKNKLSIVLGLLTTVLFISSCSKKNDTTPATQGKTAKFTITINGAADGDVATLGVNSNAVNGSTSLWKVNGVVQNNQKILDLETPSFTGTTKTYVVESNTPLTGVIIANVTCVAATGHTLTVSFQSEINGAVKENDQNVTVTKNSPYTPNFTY